MSCYFHSPLPLSLYLSKPKSPFPPTFLHLLCTSTILKSLIQCVCFYCLFVCYQSYNAAMAMTSFLSLILSAISLLIAFLLLLSPSHCFNSIQSPNSLKGLLKEEKTRLGSTPPSCHNKCNQCHPCMAVQVPTLPSHNRVVPSLNRFMPALEYSDPSPSSNRYSNYKPLGWKCRCNGHFYNP